MLGFVCMLCCCAVCGGFDVSVSGGAGETAGLDDDNVVVLQRSSSSEPG